MRRLLTAAGCAWVIALLLTACGASNEDELRQWMAEQRQQTRPRLNAIPEPKPFKPEPYSPAAAVDPFSRDKLSQAIKRETAQRAVNTALIAPERARRKEALEAFPLDSLTLVGSMTQAGRPVALIRVDNLLYTVRPGHYIGQNYGRVTKITETELTLREIVQDAAGEWVERPAVLQLQERAK